MELVLEVLFFLWIALFQLAGLGLAVLLLAKPDRVLSFIVKRSPARNSATFLAVGRVAVKLPPYRWFLHGDSAETFLQTAADNPRAYNRLVVYVRVLGALTLVGGLAIWTTVVVFVLANWFGG